MTPAELLFLTGWGLFVHNPIHASIHAATAKSIPGVEIVTWKPYPGIYRGRFRMDDLTALCYDCDPSQIEKRSYTPQAFNSVLYSTTAISSNAISNNTLKRYVIIAGMFVPLVDSSVNYTVGFLPGFRGDNDFRRFSIKEKAVIGAVIGLAWYYAVNVFISAK